MSFRGIKILIFLIPSIQAPGFLEAASNKAL